MYTLVEVDPGMLVELARLDVANDGVGVEVVGASLVEVAADVGRLVVELGATDPDESDVVADVTFTVEVILTTEVDVNVGVGVVVDCFNVFVVCWPETVVVLASNIFRQLKCFVSKFNTTNPEPRSEAEARSMQQKQTQELSSPAHYCYVRW